MAKTMFEHLWKWRSFHFQMPFALVSLGTSQFSDSFCKRISLSCFGPSLDFPERSREMTYVRFPNPTKIPNLAYLERENRKKSFNWIILLRLIPISSMIIPISLSRRAAFIILSKAFLSIEKILGNESNAFDYLEYAHQVSRGSIKRRRL